MAKEVEEIACADKVPIRWRPSGRVVHLLDQEPAGAVSLKPVQSQLELLPPHIPLPGCVGHREHRMRPLRSSGKDRRRRPRSSHIVVQGFDRSYTGGDADHIVPVPSAVRTTLSFILKDYSAPNDVC